MRKVGLTDLCHLSTAWINFAAMIASERVPSERDSNNRALEPNMTPVEEEEEEEEEVEAAEDFFFVFLFVPISLSCFAFIFPMTTRSALEISGIYLCV